jgi:tetratricopeptide (TPR) repeat protein
VLPLILILLLFYGFTRCVYGNSNDTLIKSAAKHYKAGEYGKAIENYEKVLASGFESPELYFNLGNAYYKAGILASSILNYERAKRLSPGDEDVNYNLELARRHVVDKIDALPEFFITAWINKIINITSSDHWANVSIVSFVIFLVLVSVFLFSAKTGLKKFSFLTGIIVIIISAASFIFSMKQRNDLLKHDYAIIFNPTVTAKSSPDEAGTDLFVVHEGTRISITDSIGEWKEIKLSDGNKGWVHKTSIAVI